MPEKKQGLYFVVGARHLQLCIVNIGKVRIKRKCFLFLALFLCFFTIRGFCQHSPALFHLSGIDTYYKLGISSTNVIIQDAQGFIWIGTDKGLLRYDGEAFETFPSKKDQRLPPGAVRSLLYIDPELWIGGREGLWSFHPETRDIRQIIRPKGNFEIIRLLEDKMYIMALASNATLFRIHKTNFAIDSIALPFKQTTGAGDIISDRNVPGRFWISGMEGICSIDFPSKTVTFIAPPTDQWIVHLNRGLHLYMDQAGTIWISSVWMHLAGYNPASDSWKFIPIKIAADINHPVNNIIIFYPYKEDTLMVITREHIPGFFHCTTHSFQWFDEINLNTSVFKDGQSGFINHIFKDQSGIFWFSHLLGFSRMIDEPDMFHYVDFYQNGKYPKRNNFQTDFLEHPYKSLLYIATSKGDGLLIQNLENSSFSWIPSPFRKEGYYDVKMHKLGWLRNTLWLATEKGLMYYREGYKQLELFSLPGDSLFASSINGLAVDPVQAKLIISVRGQGIYILNPAQQQYKLLYRGATEKVYSDILHRIWIPLEQKLLVMSEAGDTIFQAGPGDLGLPEDEKLSITDILVTKENHIWVTTSRWGLFHIQEIQGRFSIQRFSMEDGFFSNQFYHAVQDHKGKIWLASFSGIASIDPKDKHINEFGLSEGMGFINRTGGMAIRRNGYILIGANRSYEYFHPDTLKNNVTLPIPYIKSLKTGSSFTEIDPVPGEIVLSYYHNRILFELGALQFSLKRNVNFAFMMEGFDENWSWSETHGNIVYNNLPPGTYIFRYKAYVPGDIGFFTEKSIIIKVRPPFWQTTWFYILVICLAILTGIILYKIIQRRNIRKKIAELTAFFDHGKPQNFSVNAILWDMVRNSIAKLKIEDCVIYLPDESGRKWVQKAAWGPKNVFADFILDPIEIEQGKGIVGHVAITGKAEIIHDTSKDSRYIIDDAVRYSELTVPVIHNEKVIAIIDSENSRKHFYKKWHLEALQALAKAFAPLLAHALQQEAILLKETKLKALKQQVTETRLMALRTQINPHFIFNSLNAIRECIVTEKFDKAELYLMHFSKLLRLVLEWGDKNLAPIEVELNMIRLFVDLESLRFNHEFSATLFVDENIPREDMYIPVMMIQPFIENAIWHGLLHKEGKKTIHIGFHYVSGEQIRCIIEDDGIGIEVSQKQNREKSRKEKSLGLALTYKRLQLLKEQYGLESSCTIEDLSSEGKTGTRVTLLLPLIDFYV